MHDKEQAGLAKAIDEALGTGRIEGTGLARRPAFHVCDHGPGSCASVIIGGARAYQTYVLLANPNTTPAEVQVRFLKNGNATVRTYTLNPTSRLNIWVNNDVPELGEGSFSADIQVLNYQPIAVEKALYWDAAGIVWAGGTNVTATRLPPP